MKIQYNGSSKILKRLVELVNRSQNVALRQDNTDKNTLYWTGLDGVEITVNIPSGAVEVDAELSETSTNPAENQAITKELAKKADKSAIPTVGDGVLSVQRNGKSVGTFSANAAENASVNIPVPEKVSELENDSGYGTYTKPAAGIPKSDLASDVQASLGKADTALQKHQDISGKLDKTGDASNTTVAFSAASARENVKTGEKLSAIVGKIAKWFADLKTVAFTGSYNDLANKPTIPDVSGKQDKSTAVTHTASTAVGSTAKPVYIAGDGKATPITHSINSDVPANAKFTDTTYSDVTETTHGLMTAEDKKKLNGLEASKFMNLNNSAIFIHGAGGTAQWYRLGTLVSSGNFNTAIIRILSGDGANGYARQNSSFEIHIKDAWQSTETASAKACGVTVYRINCANVKVKVIPTAHNTYTVWVYLPWGYWNGDYAVYGKYVSWTTARLVQPDEPDGTASETAYYDCAFLDSTVAAAQTLTDSGWVAMTVEGYAKSGTVKYRTYGKQITITGSVVLKTDIATSYPAPQNIASTTFDFSKIVGCSGVGRSSSGVGAYVSAKNYNEDNIVCVHALGSKIAAGSTLIFTITGFID